MMKNLVVGAWVVDVVGAMVLLSGGRISPQPRIHRDRTCKGLVTREQEQSVWSGLGVSIWKRKRDLVVVGASVVDVVGATVLLRRPF